MIDWMREDVAEWLKRPLEVYYPVVFIDAIHVKVRRQTVASEAFYVVLGVTPDRRREVLGIAHQPSESATGWEMILRDLRQRGLEKIGLIVADGLTGLEEAAGRAYPRSDFQRCVTHVKRRLVARVRTEDKQDLAEQLRQVIDTDRLDDHSTAGRRG